ncbi:MAG: hypothetical protein AAFX10_12845 [Pseudomonadota bacterium]
MSAGLVEKHVMRTGGALLVCFAVVGCGSVPDRGRDDLFSSGGLPPDHAASSLANLGDYFTENDLPSGSWRNENGTRICDGHMTRFAGQEYCVAKVPEEWTPFTFNDRQYYLQPLTGIED